MIIKEFYRTRGDGINLYRSYSDEGYIIKKIDTEEEYEEAVDIETANYEYKETENKIPGYQTPKEEETDDWDTEAEASYLKGVNEA